MLDNCSLYCYCHHGYDLEGNKWALVAMHAKVSFVAQPVLLVTIQKYFFLAGYELSNKLASYFRLDLEAATALFAA